MAYIQGYGQSWTQNQPGGELQSYAPSNGAAPQAPSLASPDQYESLSLDNSGTGGSAGMAGSQFGSAGMAGGASSTPGSQPNQSNFSGLAATPGGQMTFNGQQFVANNGQWTPAQAGSPQGQGQQGGYAPPSWLPQNPHQQNAGGTDVLGNYNSLNSRNFASLDTANALAKQLGGNVVATNYADGARTPEYNIDFGRGSALNAGQLAYYYGPNSSFAGIRDPADREAAIRRSIEDELKYNDSPMERQITDWRDPTFSMHKDVPGGYQSGVKTGAGAPSLGPSFWDGAPQMPWQQNSTLR